MARRQEGVIPILKGLVKGGEAREVAVAALLGPDNLFQPFTTTSPGRYPEEFAAVRASLAVAEPAMLSFGCSSGDELVTLAAEFPSARVHGIDINPLAVRHAKRRIREEGLADRVSVARGSDASAEPRAAYDVIWAMAVFRHGSLKSQPTTCTEFLRFVDFERTITSLDAALKPGGLLVIRHANFRLTDCRATAAYEPVQTGFPSSNEQGVTPIYGPDDRLIAGAAGDDGVYRKG